ncbi:MAG TPA: hypothetical protein PLD48_07920 [Bacillota bacterium]|nr:hypothetical protein [Bacillota bacterium]HOK69486.1 hypothetical protein [Bacillota bacterium]HPP85688.1 hypothetical protein [Bacillota bacterium]
MAGTGLTELNFIIWAFVIGVGLAAVYTFYIKKVLGDLVRRLIAIDACSPETAISLEKINYKMNAIVQTELKRNGSYAETVKVTESGLYYINPEMLAKAKTKYKNDFMPILFLVVLLVALAGLGLLATYVLPGLLERVFDSFGL